MEGAHIPLQVATAAMKTKCVAKPSLPGCIFRTDFFFFFHAFSDLTMCTLDPCTQQKIWQTESDIACYCEFKNYAHNVSVLVMIKKDQETR